MAHPETNPNFSLPSGGNTLDQPGPTLLRATWRNIPRSAHEQPPLPQPQYNEPNNPFGPMGRVSEPRSRVLDEPMPRLKPPSYSDDDNYQIPSQAPPGRVMDPRSRGAQPDTNEYPVHPQGSTGRVGDPRNHVLDELAPRLKPSKTGNYPIQTPEKMGWVADPRNRVLDEPTPQPKTSETDNYPVQSQGKMGWVVDPRSGVQPTTRPEATTYPETDRYPIHVGQRQGFLPARSEQPRPKRGKSRGKIQWVKQPAPHGQPASNHTPTRDQTKHNHPTPLHMQRPQKTKLVTWCIAIFCAIFWIVIIVGGLIILIVYLIFRPQSPRFDITAGTLNAAYLDMDHLNADLSLLVNFTNPNRKVSVDFSYVILDIYYGGIPIGTQYIEPFSAVRSETKLKSVEMITSQVYLPLAARQKLRAQMESNGLVIFDVKGIFRARSNLGSLLRYSYPLYTHCSIYLSGPPAGVLRGRRCKTKR